MAGSSSQEQLEAKVAEVVTNLGALMGFLTPVCEGYADEEEDCLISGKCVGVGGKGSGKGRQEGRYRWDQQDGAMGEEQGRWYKT